MSFSGFSCDKTALVNSSCCTACVARVSVLGARKIVPRSLPRNCMETLTTQATCCVMNCSICHQSVKPWISILCTHVAFPSVNQRFVVKCESAVHVRGSCLFTQPADTETPAFSSSPFEIVVDILPSQGFFTHRWKNARRTYALEAMEAKNFVDAGTVLQILRCSHTQVLSRGLLLMKKILFVSTGY